ncbi:MAG: hypothetical protein AAGA60_29215 [Cyanobacteria bacterium P01_E01_bin.42]
MKVTETEIQQWVYNWGFNDARDGNICAFPYDLTYRGGYCAGVVSRECDRRAPQP